MKLNHKRFQVKHYQKNIRDLLNFHTLVPGFGMLLVVAFIYYVEEFKENLC